MGQQPRAQGFSSPVVKWSVRVNGRLTSVSIEPVFWAELKRIAEEDDVTLGQLINGIDKARLARKQTNLSSALRQYVVASLQQEAA